MLVVVPDTLPPVNVAAVFGAKHLPNSQMGSLAFKTAPEESEHIRHNTSSDNIQGKHDQTDDVHELYALYSDAMRLCFFAL